MVMRNYPDRQTAGRPQSPRVIPQNHSTTCSAVQDTAMFSSRAFPLRPRSEPGATRLATVPRVLLASVLVGLHGAGVARAQHEACAAQKLRDILPIGDARESNLKDGGIRPALKAYEERKIEIGSFLVEANKDGFIRVVNSALEAYRDYLSGLNDDTDTEHSRYNNVTRVIAPAGYGKSALFRYLEEGLKPKSTLRLPPLDTIKTQLERDHKDKINNGLINEIPLDQLRRKFAIHTTMLEELKNDAGFPMPAFAKLPAFDYDESQAPTVEFLLNAFLGDDSGLNRPILIIDSIDEIHPVSAKSLLERIDELIEHRKKAGNPSFLRVFVVGRPEGFSDYYRITQGGAPKGLPIELQPPLYQTKGDLRKAIELEVQFNVLGGGHWENAYDLKREPAPDVEANPVQRKNLILAAKVVGGEAEMLRFRIFDGDGKEVELTERAPQIGDLRKQLEPLWTQGELPEREKGLVIEKVISLVTTNRVIEFMNDRRFAFLRECPYNLSEFGELVKVSDKYGSTLDELELKEFFFQFLLGRNRASHNRPTSQNQDYIRLLEEIAYKYACKVDRNGYFFVSPGDLVHIDVMLEGQRETRRSSYLVEAVLNRSGVAYLNPANLYVPRYRFYPSWVHEHLFSSYQKRMREEEKAKK